MVTSRTVKRITHTDITIVLGPIPIHAYARVPIDAPTRGLVHAQGIVILVLLFPK